MTTLDEEASRQDAPLSTAELVRFALQQDPEAEEPNEYSTNPYWETIFALQERGNDEVWEAARKLCESPVPKERETGVNILSQNGVAEKTLAAKSAPFLLEMIRRENDASVLSSLGVALGHLNEPRATEPLAQLKDHPSSDVRFGVVMGLLTQESDLAIQTLIELSQDEDGHVRDWATFGLGVQIEADTPEIREALFKRLSDPDGDTHYEALVGLAIRKDERVVEPLIREITSHQVGRLAVEAAREIASPRLYPALVELKKWWDVDEQMLNEAIESCHPRPL